MRHLIGALALAALAGALSGCGHDMEQRAATGGVAGAAVGGASLIAVGIWFIVDNLAGLILQYIPFFLIVVGCIFIIDAILAIAVRKEDDVITIRISGSGFLYNMVRIIVGTLVEIGAGFRPVEDMQRILDAKDRAQAGNTAPSNGLTLKSIVPAEGPDMTEEEEE